MPGLDTPLLSACRRYATSPEPEYDRASGHATPTSPPTSALIVAERRHSAVTRYAERSAACRDSTRPCCRRAGGTQLPQSRSMTARAVTSPPHHRRHPHTSSRSDGTLPGLDTPLLTACRRYATTPEQESDRASGHAFSYPPTASGAHAPTHMRR